MMSWSKILFAVSREAPFDEHKAPVLVSQNLKTPEKAFDDILVYMLFTVSREPPFDEQTPFWHLRISKPPKKYFDDVLV